MMPGCGKHGGIAVHCLLRSQIERHLTSRSLVHGCRHPSHEFDGVIILRVKGDAGRPKTRGGGGGEMIRNS